MIFTQKSCSTSSTHMALPRAYVSNLLLSRLLVRKLTYFSSVLHDLYPARRTCLDPACAVTLSNGTRRLRSLEKIIPTQCVRFTRDFGPVNAICYSAHCRRASTIFFIYPIAFSHSWHPECNTRYYPAYYVHESAALRTHYPGVPRVLHVQKHSFIDTSLCERFTFEMVCAWYVCIHISDEIWFDTCTGCLAAITHSSTTLSTGWSTQIILAGTRHRCFRAL